MRVWSLLILALLLSILIGAAAGHDWMSPGEVVCSSDRSSRVSSWTSRRL